MARGAWSYAIWGFWHGAALIGERAARGTRFYASRHRAIRAVRMALVFAVVTAGWLLFKLPHVSDAAAFALALFSNTGLRTARSTVFIVAIYVLLVALYDAHYLMRRRAQARGTIAVLDGAAKPIVLGLLLSAIALNPGPRQSFIYFQF